MNRDGRKDNRRAFGKNIRAGASAAVLTIVLFLIFAVPFNVYAQESTGELTVLFTHDIHDYLYPTVSLKGGTGREHGGAARLASIIKENSSENSIYLDAGDFSMGTLYQAAFSTDAYELRNLGITGCEVTTFGNHEFDYGAAGVAASLRAAAASGDPLPQIVISNIDFSGQLDDTQKDLKAAFEEYGIKEYTVIERAGMKLGIFGLEGYDSIECIQTDIPFTDYIEQADRTVKKLKAENCDLIIALSHAGTDGNAETGEDAELAKKVPGIDIIISGHSHCCYEAPVRIGSTLIVSAGEYLENVGSLTVKKGPDGLTVTDYRLISADSVTGEDPEALARMETYKESIEKNYLADKGGSFDRVIAHSSFNMMSLEEMYSTHQEYNTGDLIADSYLYEARRNGIDDVAGAIVGLGTIRGALKEGYITAADAFEICSLGVGSDGSAGHPLAAIYITGREIKLMTELDASLGPLVSTIKMSYAGVSFSFNTERILLDRVTDVHLVRQDGSREEINDDQLYKVVANMYALNMLGMLNGLTGGMLAITPKYADGTPIGNFYDVTMKTADGTEIKEWVAFMHYLESFPAGDAGVPEIPEVYRSAQGRKIRVSEGGLAVIRNPGTAVKIMPAVLGGAALFILLLAAMILLIRKAVRRRKNRKGQEAGKEIPQEKNSL